MEFIKPDEISGKILTLLEESNEYVIIVSPYVKISKWYKLIKKLNRLQERDVRLEFIIRDGSTNSNSFNELENLGINFRAIPDLHCKLYLNEKKAIFSSMNLLLSSEINSLEIGYETESEKEYLELKEFCTKYLKIQFDTVPILELDQLLIERLSELSDKRVKIQKDNGFLRINTITNNYDCFLWNSKKARKLRISGILSGREFEILNNNGVMKIKDMDVEVQSSHSKHYDLVWGTGKTQYKSDSLESVLREECESIATNVFDFIQAIDGFKRTPHHNSFE